ncbi:hypothetical protein B0G84_5336 [Paraburkholderia sp. BL8N3]|nr:hypothetical protein B0G84_5336 [Paraburkholderia sp. BL8N3]
MVGHGHLAILGVMPCMVTRSLRGWLKEDHKWPPSNAFNEATKWPFAPCHVRELCFVGQEEIDHFRIGVWAGCVTSLAGFAHGMAQYEACRDFKNLVPSPTIKQPIALCKAIGGGWMSTYARADVLH